MIFTNKIKLALQLINSQKNLPDRKDGSPYLSHPYGVAFLLAQVTNDRDIIIAGLLHDTIEDTGSEDPITLEVIQEKFGEPVSLMVEAMTEDKAIEKGLRKQKAREKIRTMSHGMLLVKSADILHNAGTFLLSMEENPEKALEKFGPTYSKAMGTLSENLQVLNEVWPENPLLEDLNYTLKTLEKFSIEA